MTDEKTPAYEQNYTAAERALADHLIGLEKSALDKWFNGDTSGYEQLWSTQSFSYFDGVVTHRIDDHAAIRETLKSIRGRLFADSYQMCAPRVQAGGDMAVLTFQLFARTSLLDMAYNCIEVYRREQNGEWHVIHSTWSFIRPMDIDFGKEKNIV